MSQIFALVATGALVSVYQMTKSKNPVHSVFYLVLLFQHCSGLLVLIGLEYFVLLQLLVYVGALAILFQFVVMLQDIPSTEILAHQRGTYPVAGVLTICIFTCAFLALWQPLSDSIYTSGVNRTIRNSGTSQDRRDISYNYWRANRAAASPVSTQGIALYGVHPDLQIIASLLLLVAMVGAVGLTLKRPIAAPDYDVFAQHYADFQKGLVQIRRPKEISGKSIVYYLFF